MKHRFEFGAKVIIDGWKDNIVVVIGVLYLPEGAVQWKCSYWMNGDLKEVWVEDWRVSEVEK